MTMVKNIEIPANRKLSLEVPRSFPIGTTAKVEVTIPVAAEPSKSIQGAIKPLRGFFKGSTFTVDRFLEERRAEERRDS